jgi:hypothetical protein
MLHTSAASLTSDSSSSLRRSRLGGIAEDVEEGTAAQDGTTRNLTTPDKLETSEMKSDKHDKVDPSVAAAVMGSSLLRREAEPASKQSGSLPPRVDSLQPPKVVSSLVLEDKKSSVYSPQHENASSLHSPPKEKSSIHSPKMEKPSSPTLSYDKPLPAPPEATSARKQLDVQPIHYQEGNDMDYQSRKSQDTNRMSFDRRPSSQTVRPRADDGASLYSGYSAYKPKKKFGPRPHKDPVGRPKTSGTVSKDQHAVANLPPNLRISNRVRSAIPARPASQQSSRSVPPNFKHHSELPSSVVPPLPQRTSHIAGLFEPAGAGPFIATTALNPQKEPTIAPEKLRLMKALQMRKKQQALAKHASMVSPAPNVDAPGSEKMAVSEDPAGAQTSSEPLEAPTGDIESGTKEEGIGNEPAKVITAPSASLDRITEDQPPIVSWAENDHPVQHLDVSNIKILKEPQKELPVQKDSGLSSLADVQTLTPEPLVAASTQQHSPGMQTQPEADETKRASPQGFSSNTQAGSHASDTKRPIATLPLSPLAIPDFSRHQVQLVEKQGELSSDIDAANVVSDMPQADSLTRNAKRRGLVEPIKAPPSPEASDESDDDSFIEELQHAKLEQAKPVSVGRSPITPIYRNSSDRPREVTRTSSAPIQIKTNSTTSTPEKPRSIGGRSPSTALPPLPPMTGDSGYALAAKKGSVSSGITTRIKALESFSRREVNTSPSQTPPPQPISQISTPSMWSFKKRTSLAQIKSNLPNTSTSKLPPAQLPTPQSTPTPTPKPNLSSPPRPLVQRTGSNAPLDAPLQKGDSISVTARIIRDPGQNFTEPPENPSEAVPMNLHRSPLTVEHERAELNSPPPALSTVASSIRPGSRPTSPKVERTRFSFSSTRSSVPKLPPSDSMAGRMSQASGHNKKASGNLPLSSGDASPAVEDKPKESRTSRLMRRMSNLTGGSRRNLFTSLSPNGREPMSPPPIAEHQESLAEQSSLSDSLIQVVDIGDVNVQFPDTLLWKRRFMRIDDQGYLVLTPPSKETMERNRGISRRFHLSEFKKPTLPDPEREELPWSILLDFEDGTSLQCACETRYAQTQVLKSELPSAFGLLDPVLT